MQPAATKATIGLVTVTYNSADVIEAFLECYERQTLADDLHLVAIDNASGDATLAIMRRRSTSRITLIANPTNTGVAAGNNQGIEHCRKLGIEWILLINNDTEFDAGICRALLASARELRARVLTPRITYYDQPGRDWFAGGHFSWLRGFQSRHSRPRSGPSARRPRTISYAPTCCMLVHASVFDEVGLMDPAYFVYWDDTDFCWRLHQRGIAIYFDPRISIAHKVSTLTGGQQSAFSVRHYNRNQVYFLRKHFGTATVAWNIAWIRCKNRIRRLIGLDDAAVAAQRRSAIAEGLRMSVDSSG